MLFLASVLLRESDYSCLYLICLQQLSKTVNNPPKPSNTPPQSPTKDSIASIRNLIENKFASLGERTEAIENKIIEQYEEVIGLVRNIDKTAKSALDLAMSNSALIAENTEKISSH